MGEQAEVERLSILAAEIIGFLETKGCTPREGILATISASARMLASQCWRQGASPAQAAESIGMSYVTAVTEMHREIIATQGEKPPPAGA